MKNTRNIIIGLIFIVLGVIFGSNALGYTNIDIFFDGWWTFLLIIPCSINIFKGRDIWGNLAGICAGAVLLLICQGYLPLRTVSKLIFPACLVCLGVWLIFKDSFNPAAKMRIKELNRKKASHKGIYALFSSQNINFAGELFSGTNLTAAFGTIDCNLAFSEIQSDCVINANAIFGGIDIVLPENVNVVVRSGSIFGGVSKKRIFTPLPGIPTVFINATCLFGGVDLK